jgi:hypothetical protein
MKRLLPGLLLLLILPLTAAAGPAGVLRLTSDQPIEAVYDRLYKALEAEKFWVVFEADMGQRMAKMAERWGEDYNRSGLDAVKSLVFCNLWWTNRLANADPDLLGLCPLHATLYVKEGMTVVVMPAIGAMAEGSPGAGAARELEAELTAIVGAALKGD